MSQIANWIDLALSNHEDDNNLKAIKSKVTELCATFPIYKTDTVLAN
jgi:glycine/serine hydroxymethyltransferase